MHACGRIKPEALLAWIDRATLAIQDLRELWEPANVSVQGTDGAFRTGLADN